MTPEKMPVISSQDFTHVLQSISRDVMVSLPLFNLGTRFVA
jgi:hypothetical protein